MGKLKDWWKNRSYWQKGGIVVLILLLVLVSGCIKEKEKEYYCEQDSDCVLAINIGVCCDCPSIYTKEEVNANNNLIIYEKGKDYSLLITADCTGKNRVLCSPCKPIINIRCYNNKCIENPKMTIEQLIDSLPSPENSKELIKNELITKGTVRVDVEISNKDKFNEVLDSLTEEEFKLEETAMILEPYAFEGIITQSGLEKLQKNPYISKIWYGFYSSSTLQNSMFTINQENIVKQYCGNVSSCECGFKETNKLLDEFKKIGFNCNITKDVKIYEYNPCKYCDNMICVPERGTEYYFVSDKVKAILKVSGQPVEAGQSGVTNQCF